MNIEYKEYDETDYYILKIKHVVVKKDKEFQVFIDSDVCNGDGFNISENKYFHWFFDCKEEDIKDLIYFALSIGEICNFILRKSKNWVAIWQLLIHFGVVIQKKPFDDD